MTVNASPGSSTASRSPARSRWAVDEIGRNSVSPWRMPSSAATGSVTRQEARAFFDFALPPTGAAAAGAAPAERVARRWLRMMAMDEAMNTVE